MATQQQIDLRKKLLNKAIKPTTNPLQQQKNQKRFDTLNKLNTVAPVTTPVAPVTVDPMAPALVDPGTASLSTTTKPAKGVFTNKTTGAYTNANGDAVDVNGVKITDTAPEAPATYAEIGAANVQAEYDANLATELDLTGQETGYTSLEEYTKDLYNQNKEQAALQKEQLDLQKTQNAEQTSAGRNAQENQVTAGTPLIGSQEGVTSTSNQTAYGEAKNAASVQISRLFRDNEVSNKAIEQAKVDLARAERAGNTQLAEQYRSTLLAAESAAQQTETAYVNALTMASEEERNVQAQNNANLQSFTEMVDTGNEMTVESISGFANRLGIDFDTAYGYYAGAQAIRDDKNLSLEEKQIANAQNLQNLNDQISGMDIEEVKKATVYNDMVKSGQYTQEQLQVLSSAMGISDQYNESYQAQLAYDQASAKIQQQIANGELVNPLDLIDLATKTYALSEAMGQTQGGVPAGGGSAETTAVATDNGIRFGFEDGAKISSAKRAISQCGQFVNDTLGIGVGDDLASKMAYVDQSILVPVAGMGFVTDRGMTLANGKNTGHTGIVEYYNSVTGMVGVADVNYNGDGLALHHEIPLAEFKAGTNNGGFMPLQENSTPISGEFSYSSYYDQALAEGRSIESAEKYANDMVKSSSTWANEFSQKQYIQYTMLVPEEKTYVEKTEGMDDAQLEDYAENNGAFAQDLINREPDDEITTQMLNEFFTNPEERALALAQKRWVAAKLRGESGAAITVSEYIDAMQSFWPQSGDDAEEIRRKEDRRNEYVGGVKDALDLYGKKLLSEKEKTEQSSTSAAAAEADAKKAAVDEYNALEQQNNPDYQEWISSQIKGLSSGFGSASPLKQ